MARHLLVYPPLTDPTSPYHSTSYLAAYAQREGHVVDIIDANIESVAFNLGPGPLRDLAASAVAPSPRPTSRAASDALLARRTLDPGAVLDAAGTMRDPARFFEYGKYRSAVETLTGWLGAWSCLGVPGQFGGGFDLDKALVGNLDNLAVLTKPSVLQRIAAPMQNYIDEVFLPRTRAGSYCSVGFSVTYSAQLPFALHMARALRHALGSDVMLFVGGTDVSDVWKYLRKPEDFFHVFDDFDAAVVGEGEAAYVSLLEDTERGYMNAHPNTVVHARHRVGDPNGRPLVYTALEELPTPDYSQFPMQKYLAPFPFIYYSPSRGCYWNKCTFCDYGLNFGSPTSPWRQDRADKTVQDLARLSQDYKYIYFSVDVLAPARLLQIAGALVERSIDIRWSAEIRLEEYWDDEKCALLYASGARAVSVGFESGNQRILDRIAKGVSAQAVPDVLKHFTRAGIGVQLMGFTGFPTETEAEALESVNFMERTRGLWTLGGLGTFQLTLGAEVAREPAKFGISAVIASPGDDIRRELGYVLEGDSKTVHPQPETPAVQAAKRRLARRDWRRPWLGGIDTPHTIMYHDRFGIGLHELLDHREDQAAEHQALVLNGTFLEAPSATAGGTETRFLRKDGRSLVLPQEMNDVLSRFVTPTVLADAPDVPSVEVALVRLAVARRLLVVAADRSREEEPSGQTRRSR